jgi:hypothetical protein
MGFPPPSMIQIPYMDLIIVSGHPVSNFQNILKKKRLSRVCLSKRNIFAKSTFLCVFWRYRADWTDEGDRDRQTNRLTVCVVHIQKYKILSTSTRLTLHMQLCSQTEKFKQWPNANSHGSSHQPLQTNVETVFYIKPLIIPFQILANSLATNQPIMLIRDNFSS